MYKIVVSGIRFFMKFEKYLDYFRSRAKDAGAEIIPVYSSDEDEFIRESGNASAVVVIDRKVSSKLIENLEKCKILMALSVGYDCIDVKAATRRKIPVSNVPTYCTDEVANHALTLLVSVARKLFLLINSTKKGNWDYNVAKPIFNFRNKKLGIVGLGRIGRALVPKVKGLGIEPLAYDPYLSDDIFSLCGVERVYEFDDLLEKSDYISIHAPLTGETEKMFDRRVFSKMKETSILINTARGRIIDEDALYEALTRGKIAGAGLDVLSKEPPPKDHKLFSVENIIVTPHIAWYSEESFRRSMELAMDEVIRAIQGKRPWYTVNPEVFYKRT